MSLADLFLRFEDEAAAIAALPSLRASGLDGVGCWRAAGAGFALDPVGVLATPGVWDVDSQGWLVAPVAKPGWHLNLRCTAEIAALIPAAAILAPTTPDRVFA